MSNEVTSQILNHCNGVRGFKSSRTGWYTFNAVCCTHRGASRADTKYRGGFSLLPDGGLVYSCFNCGFSTQWHPGTTFNNSFKNLLEWFRMPSEMIKKLNFKTWQLRDQEGTTYEGPTINSTNYQCVELPEGAKSFGFWLENDCQDPDFFDVIQYVYSRGIDIYDGYNYFWTPNKTKQINRRVIIPFLWKDKTVGYTLRAIDSVGNRYINETPNDYIFNADRIRKEDRFVFITEGPFDAIAVNACATLGDHMTVTQQAFFNSLPQRKVIIADREKSGGKLVDIALEHNWAVSMAPRSLYGSGIKDSADLVKKYGKLYAIRSIIDNIVESPLKIKALRQLTFR